MPVEIRVPNLRIMDFNEDEIKDDDQELRISLDLLDQIREDAARGPRVYQGRVTKYYNQKVKYIPLKVGDMVLRNAAATYKGEELKKAYGKIAAKWEGPYKIVEDFGYGSYKLTYKQGEEWFTIDKNWNVNNLKKY